MPILKTSTPQNTGLFRHDRLRVWAGPVTLKLALDAPVLRVVVTGGLVVWVATAGRSSETGGM
jgi:hypothetical protein